MKEKSPVQLELFNVQTEIKPSFARENVVEDYIPFGSDNLFPQAMALFGRTSPNHRGVINNKKTYACGSDIISSDSLAKTFLDTVNNQGESLHDILLKLELDYVMGGNGYIEVIRDRSKRWVMLNHIDFTKCRKNKEKTHILIHPDWGTYTGKQDKNLISLPIFPKFEFSGGVERSVYHLYDYEPEFSDYGLPSWISGKDAVQIDFKSNRFNLARLINTFRVSGMLFVPVKDAGESQEVLKRMTEAYTGDMNQDKLLVVTKSRSTENEKADQVQLIQNNNQDKGSWIELHSMSITDIIVAHSWFRSLTSLPDNTGFDTNRIINEYNIALSTYILPTQKFIKKMINKIMKAAIGKAIEFDFINESPIYIEDGMFIWELRKKKGLDYNESDPVQQKIIYNGQLV